ncbi:LL-diaminopimelate aminotransferase [bioreactor metagenome]|uniref:LL-diaminopimelate aminotransferase n=1 Tax=bioreactor metagenome TaxID=1076179 RepID=A0A645FCH9_9ZZZZ
MLIPNPFYTVFEMGPIMAGGQAVSYPLLRKNNYLPDFDAIPEDVAKAAKCILVSFPSNPLGKIATDEMYLKLIEFANKHNIVVVHDNAYSEIIYDGKKGRSFLEFDGAKEIGVEFNSLSKTYNMTGCRIGFCVGNEEIVQKLYLMRMQLDYCDFYPVQFGAIAALNGPQDEVVSQRGKYQKRRDVMCRGLRKIGFDMPDSEATMFGWAPIPSGYSDSEEFCLDLLNKTGVLFTPGSSFGEYGEGYFRVSFTQPTEIMEEAIDIIDKSGLAKGK